jgi:hypothetical protein
MRWVICSFKPQVNRMKTDRVMAGKAYSKDRGSAQDSAWDATRVRGFGAWSIEDAVDNLQLQTPSQSDEN